MTKEIVLTKGQVALVDDDIYDELNQHKWLFTTGYAARCPTWKGPCILMHRVVVDAQPDEEVDHANGNGLDNRRSNLRACTHSQNLINRPKPRNNTSGFKGVSFRKSRRDGKDWRATIRCQQVSKEIGRYKTRLEAARAYNIWAYKLFGEFAQLNVTWDEVNLCPMKE